MADLESMVAAARDGDRDAFDRLVRATYASTYTLAYRLTGDPEDASDVVQEVYLRAYKGLRRYRGDSQVTTWLYRITANCSATHHGRRRRHLHETMPDEGQVMDADRAVDPHDRAEQVELRDRLERAVAALPARLRAVVVLRDVYGLSHDAIADELGITESAAKVRLHRARRRLRDDLAGRIEHGQEQARAV
ncbi:MAG: RNA polymerase sigma factor [Acidimicrobiia bacterium]